MISRFLHKFFDYSTAGPALIRFYLLPRVKVHHILKSDTEFHNHPWSAISIIFGWYIETLEEGPVTRLRLGFNYLPAKRKHKLTIFKPVWTLFINGPRVNKDWSYGAIKQPWQGSDQERKA
jgi:hypothetical protein